MKPVLDIKINPSIFINYYWLKKELIDFCRNYSLPVNGSKKDLTKRIFKYLSTGEIFKTPLEKNINKYKLKKQLSLKSIIPYDYRNDEKHRAFFKKIIGRHFKFNTVFMNWMKNNAGKTYKDAIIEWDKIYQEKKSGKKYDISSQFEYNQYIRDFFKENPGLNLGDAISCWKYKKSQPGLNKYEIKDLKVLKKSKNV